MGSKSNDLLNLCHELFDVDVNKGVFIYKFQRARRKKGDIASFVDDAGYVRIFIKGKHYSAHRLIFLCAKGYLPKYIDHIDGDKTNNSISNLREATKTQNNRNRKINTNNTSGYKGVYRLSGDSSWAARICVNGKEIHLGVFPDKISAAIKYNEAAKKYHGEFARLNEIPKGAKFQDRCIKAISGYKGVRFRGGYWQARIGYKKKEFYLGRFSTPIEAARAYNMAARMYLGPKSYINKI